MITDDYNEWRECLDADHCELIASYMELIDAMVRDIQHLKAETIRARYELSQKYDEFSGVKTPPFRRSGNRESGQRKL